MNLNMMLNDEDELKPRITVFGVGGAGGNAVNNMIEKNLEGVDFVVANTDAQALAQSQAPAKIQLGPKVTEGLGAGAKPSIGAKAAEETIEDIVDHLMGAHMCFITGGMGGGTGTGAAPIIAQAAREMGILTVGVVTKPFSFEGSKRMRQADEGIEALQKVVDTLIIIPNQNLFRIANEKTTFTEAFVMADDVLYQGVKGVTDLMVRPGLINLDFADVRAVMDEMGKAMMGTGEGEGENRAVQAAEKAIANPLLDEVSLHGAKGVLINITGGHDLTLFELDEAANIIRDKVDADANIIVGSTLDETLNGAIRVSVVATGIDAKPAVADTPVPRRSMKEPLTQTPRMTEPAVEAPVPPRRVAYDDTPVEAPRAEAPAPRYEPAPQQRAETVYEDDVPAPAYQPVARPVAAGVQEPTDVFTAPTRPAGTPSDAVRERLARAVAQGGERRIPEATRAQAEAARTAERRGGLSRMFDRIAGNNEGEKVPAATLQQRVSERMATRARSSAEPDFDDLASPDSGSENVEIPAFLRRQAN